MNLMELDLMVERYRAENERLQNRIMELKRHYEGSLRNVGFGAAIMGFAAGMILMLILTGGPS